MKKNTIINIIYAILVFIYLYAAVSKFIDFRVYLKDMHNQPFPLWVSNILLWLIPISELFICFALISHQGKTIGLFSSLILISLFSVYILAILNHSFKYVPCSCGGLIRKLTWKQHLFFNLFIMSVSLLGIRIQFKVYQNNFRKGIAENLKKSKHF
jgi:hypothetical protein